MRTPIPSQPAPPAQSAEAARLAALRALAVLDTPPEPALDDITALAAAICDTPIATISLIDETRQWFKSRVGVAEAATPREHAFCAYALGGPELLVVPDARRDDRFAANPLVTGEPHIRFYAGAPLVTPAGLVMGTLCVIDRKPRQLTEPQARALRVLSRQVMVELLLRKQVAEREQAEQALQRSERAHRELVERLVEAQAVAKVGSWATDLATLAVRWSAETHRIFGTDPATFQPTHEEFLGRVHPDDRAGVDAAFRASLDRRETQSIEHRITLPDGSIKHVEERWQVYADEAGRPVRAVGTCRDITEPRRAREERDRLFNLSLDLLCVASFEGRLLQVSPSWTQCLGWTAQELTSGPMLEFVHPQDREATLRARQEIVAGRPMRGFENRYRCRDGSYRWLSWNVHPLPELRQVFSVARDVTARKAADAEKLALAERLVETLESITDAFMTMDRDWRFTYLNREAERLLARPRRELIGQVLWQEFPEATGSTFEREYRRALAENRAVVFEEFYAPLKGWFAIRAYPSEQGLAVYFRDVTEIRRAAEIVRVSEERFRLVARATNDAVWDWDMAANTLWWNEGYEKLFGYRQGEEADLTINSWKLHIHPQDLGRVMQGIQRIIQQGGETWSDDYRFRRRDGTYADVFDRGYIIRDAAGRAVRMIGGITDVTERKAAEKKLREQAALLDQARDAILVRDLRHIVSYWNKSAERLYGWAAAEIAGRSVRDFLYADVQAFDDAMARLLVAGEWSGEIVQVRRDGGLLTVEGRWSLMRDAAGEPQAVLAINTDISERKQLESQFLRAQRMESIGTLAGGIAHDLNNLLAPIAMGVELLRRYQPEPKAQRVIDNIERSARRGADLVKQVLSFARGVEGARVPLQVRHLVREVESIAENTFPKNITIQAELPNDLPLVSGDPTQLHQVFLNLCVNARDAMPDGGTLDISATSVEVDAQYAAMHAGAVPGRYVAIAVADTGTGIPPEVMDRIFEPFFTTKELGKGTGLGLSTVIGIVRSHAGFLKVESTPGQGSTFRVFLPAHLEAAAAVAAAVESPALPRGQGELILVVDDEGPILDITRHTLEVFGYRVITATDGAQAVGLYAEHRDVAVVLTDMMMPVMDGPALIAALRHINPEVALIATSGLNLTGNLARATDLGVRHFLAKPFPAEALLRQLQVILHGERPPGA